MMMNSMHLLLLVQFFTYAQSIKLLFKHNSHELV